MVIIKTFRVSTLITHYTILVLLQIINYKLYYLKKNDKRNLKEKKKEINWFTWFRWYPYEIHMQMSKTPIYYFNPLILPALVRFHLIRRRFILSSSPHSSVTLKYSNPTLFYFISSHCSVLTHSFNSFSLHSLLSLHLVLSLLLSIFSFLIRTIHCNLLLLFRFIVFLNFESNASCL